VATLIRGWLRVYHRLQILGRENLPGYPLVGRGSFVLVANHCSHLDALCLISAVPIGKLHRTISAAAADYFFVSPRRAVVAVLMVNALPFNREVYVRQSLRLCRELLANPGNVLILFPEGSRSPNGNLRAFKNGIGLLVAGTDVPVIPCYLDGTHRAMPKRAAVPRPCQVRLTIGAPRLYKDFSPDRAGSAEVAMDLHRAVQQLAPASEPVTTAV